MNVQIYNFVMLSNWLCGLLHVPTTGLSLRILADLQPVLHLVVEFHTEVHDSCPTFIVKLHAIANFQE